jgi:uncharacterized protein YegL
MHTLTKSTIDGYREFLEAQRKEPGDANVTCILFNQNYSILYEGVDLKSAPTLDDRYSADGMTAMNDAIGKAIDTTGARLATMNENDRPGKVLFVIITDGEENASHEYSYNRIAEMIKHQREVYNWEFMFLGANIDVQKTASMMNIPVANTIAYAATITGTTDMYAAMNHATMSYRSCGNLNIKDHDLTARS